MPAQQWRIGVVGLGAMGGSIVSRLLTSGYDVHVRDLNAVALQRLIDEGATEASLAEIAGVDLLVLSLPSDAAVCTVVAELTAQEARPRIVLEMSTVRPETVRALPAAFGVGVEVVDAPVSGGPADAIGGTLSVLVGTDAPLAPLTRSVLETLGAVHLVGRLGDGKLVKLVNNMISMSNVAVAAEAFQLGVGLGLNPKRLYQVLSESGASSRHFNKRFPWVCADDFAARFAVRLAEKDLRLAIDVAHGSSYATPIVAAIHQVYERAMGSGLADEDIVSLVKLYRRNEETA